MPTTAEGRSGRAVFYALGSGAGHLARSLVVARRFERACIFHRSARLPSALPSSIDLRRVPDGCTFSALREALARELRDGAELVVDTFPGGVAHELDDALLALARRRSLVRRYVIPGTYDDYTTLAARFECVFSPYPAGDSEWEDENPADEAIGYAVRSVRIGTGRGAPLVVVGDARLLPPGMRACLPSGTRVVDGPFDELPPAEGYLALGAGYNLTYELLRAGVAFRLVPQARRYDDPFRRADRLRRAVTSRACLERWLGGEGRGRVA